MNFQHRSHGKKTRCLSRKIRVPNSVCLRHKSFGKDSTLPFIALILKNNFYTYAGHPVCQTTIKSHTRGNKIWGTMESTQSDRFITKILEPQDINTEARRNLPRGGETTWTLNAKNLSKTPALLWTRGCSQLVLKMSIIHILICPIHRVRHLFLLTCM